MTLLGCLERSPLLLGCGPDSSHGENTLKAIAHEFNSSWAFNNAQQCQNVVSKVMPWIAVSRLGIAVTFWIEVYVA